MLDSVLEATWERYVQSWKAGTKSEKIALFENALDPSCCYNDPLAKTIGWDELAAYMLAFHEQVPGGHFVTTSFSSHSNRCAVTWSMRDGNNVELLDGISYGEFNEDGRLTAMTGFFEPLNR